MKPNQTILDTDFYQLASDGSATVSLILPKGAKNMQNFSKTFKIGSEGADYIANFYNFVDGYWQIITRGYITIWIRSGVIIMGGLHRSASGEFTLTLLYNTSSEFTSTEDVEVKVRIKTFLFPEL